MRKELSPVHELAACEVCGRTILKGERTEPYLAPDGGRHSVCDLCVLRAESAGWIRESARADMPTARPRSAPRPSLMERLRRLRAANGAVRGTGPGVGADQEEPAVEEDVAIEASESQPGGEAAWPDLEIEAYEREPAPEPARARDQPTGPRDPRHVRAIPTNAQVKVERALELFNASEERRTVGGLIRTLGEPWVVALPVLESASEVTVVIAWELSWYRYRIDLGDAGESVLLVEKGQEINEIDSELRHWNGQAASDGSLSAGLVPET